MILALSNLGTSFASAILAKDTTTNTNNELVGKKNGEVVAIGSAVKIYTANAPSDQSSRKLSNCETSNGKKTKCTITSYVQVEVDDGRQMVEECHEGRSTVKFDKVSGSMTKQVTICNKGNSGRCADTYYNIGDPLVHPSVKLCNGITIGPNPDNNSFYMISGDAATSDEFEGCDSSTDCDDGLECTSDGTTNVCTVEPATGESGIVCDSSFDSSFIGAACDAAQAQANLACSWTCPDGISTEGECTCTTTESADKDGNPIFKYNWG